MAQASAPSSPSSLLPLIAFGGAMAAGMLFKPPPPRRTSFRDQVVLVTGGSRGLGLAMAERFAVESARLVLVARSLDQLERAAERLRARGAASVSIFPCDIRDRAGVERLVAEVVRERGRIDVLVNNAGVIQVTPFEHAQIEDFQDSLDTHLWGPLYFIRACLPHFIAQRGGRIINISSIGGRIAVPHLLPYCVGKFALAGLSDGLHAELRRHNVLVTTVTPHLMRTGSHRNTLVRGQHKKEAVMFALGSTPLTAIDAGRAAAMIVNASRTGRAQIAPGWPARAAQLLQAIAPEAVAALFAAATAWALPAPTSRPAGDRGQQSRDIDTGAVARVFATQAALRFNQRVSPDEAAQLRA